MSVEVCAICDIAGCKHIREREDVRDEVMTLNAYGATWVPVEDLTNLRAQLATAQEERDTYAKAAAFWSKAYYSLQVDEQVDAILALSALDRPEAQDGVAAAAKVLLDRLENPHDHADNIQWQKVYDAMTEDHAESMEICGHHDWPATLVTALTEIVEQLEAARLSRAED